MSLFFEFNTVVLIIVLHLFKLQLIVNSCTIVFLYEKHTHGVFGVILQ